jgi:Uncharacterized protein conserved in bacteria (DUF2330)
MRYLLIALISVMLLAPASASACGMPLNARIASERALIVFDGQTAAITLGIGIEPEAADAAVIFPVPAPPEVDQPAGGEALFSYLEQVTRPTVQVERQLRWGFDPGFDGLTGGAAPPGGVELLGRETLGGYDVARLAADDPQALSGWLADNGFSLPTGADPILAAYVAEGWSFVAVRLAPDAPGGSLAPLRMSYPASEIVYPRRFDSLSDRSVGIDLYLVASHRTTVDGFETTYAGPIAALDEPPAAELAAILADGSYLTRLSHTELAPEQISADAVARQAPSDEPYRKVVTISQQIWVFSAYGWEIVGLVAFLLLSFSLIAVALFLRRRIQAIGDNETS